MTIRTITFLPEVFQTPANKKFLNATLDQLVTEPNLRKINGYVGRKFAPTFKSTDSYIVEETEDRQNYQLEPCVVTTDDNKKINHLSSYLDLINKVGYYGGITNDHSRLFRNEAYSFDGLIDFDKLVNFTQYYWLPSGPEAVDVYAGGVDLEQEYTVTRNEQLHAYIISGFDSMQNPDITLARGGKYTFKVNQEGDEFWIQTTPGISGTVTNKSNISSRAVYGVEENGASNGVVVFNVPLRDEQDYFINLPKDQVDFATDLNFVDVNHVLVNNLTQGLDGVISQLQGKTVIFVNNDFSDTAWENKGVYALNAYDKDTNLADNIDEDPYDNGPYVPIAHRTGIWQININSSGGTDLIELAWLRNVPVESKVVVLSGSKYANLEFYRDTLGNFAEVPLITAPLTQLYYNDGKDQRYYGRINIVDADNTSINVTNDILGKPKYISPNGVEFTNGLKVRFNSAAVPAYYASSEFYVDGVGSSIRLTKVSTLVTPESATDTSIPFDVYGFSDEYFDQSLSGPLVADYITINRSSLDANAWSRGNRWFHSSIVEVTAAYNKTVPVFDQSKRAVRPIIEFDADLHLYNYGRVGKHVDVVDFTITDALNEVEGVSNNYFKTSNFRDGMTIIFANDLDPVVRNQIYKVNVLKINSEVKIHLTQVDDGKILEYNSVIPVNGCTVLMDDFDLTSPLALNKDARTMSASNGIPVLPLDGVLSPTVGLIMGYSFWFNGTSWVYSQQKDGVNIAPKFDIFDQQGVSFGDTSTYVNSSFAGCDIFSYKLGTGANDSVLGFPMSYRNFNNVGDIEFKNSYDSDSFTEILNKITVTHKINTGTPKKIKSLSETYNVNIWTTLTEKTKQYQIISNLCDGKTSYFEIDILPDTQIVSPNIKVYVNSVRLSSAYYSIVDVGDRKAVYITSSLSLNDRVDILIYSLSSSQYGYYEIPQNLDFNPLNENFTSLTLGQFRNHLITMSGNNSDVVGQVPGNSNIRDLDVKPCGGSIMQHSAPAVYSSLFLIEKDVNFVDSIKFAQHEYLKFKNKFLESATSAINAGISNSVDAVDYILHNINEVKSIVSPWYYSDMVPYDQNRTDVEYTVLNIEISEYEIDSIFNDTELSNKAILVYCNGEQLIKGIDYKFNQTRPSVIFLKTLDYDDVIQIRIYHNTDGCYIPETPTKLGLYPKFMPEVYEDTTYQNPVTVIRGHDGSITPLFNDFRDDILLELEKRIYNNIKISYNHSNFDINDVVPGKFRDTGYARSEFNQVVSKGFLDWVSSTKIDYSTNEWFASNNPWTWNYRRFRDIGGELLPGFWRGIYKYFFDTDAPHTRPWECLGFSEKPNWWEETYGPAPYTGGNLVLWGDLETGTIRSGDRAGVDARYARPGLSSVIPVTDSGELISPDKIFTSTATSGDASGPFAIGDHGPVESAWRNSSAYPFAVQQAIAVMIPARYFGQLASIQSYQKDTSINQYVHDSTKQRITPVDFAVNNSTTKNAGYLNWIADYITSYGGNPVTKISSYLTTLTTRLGYKVAGFTDKAFLRVLAEQSSPGSTNDSIIVPDDNYVAYLHKSSPVDRIVYSAVVVEKTNSGYSVTGYNTENPLFTIIPSNASSNQHTISTGETTGVVYEDYQQVKVNIPYGYEFRNKQQVVDFLISYERFLKSQGFLFNEFNQSLGEMMNWELSALEFLTWTEQGWAEGNIIVLSPVANFISVLYDGAVVDKIDNLPAGSKILDVGFNVIRPSMFNITREGNSFELMTDAEVSIGLLDLNLVQYEHVLVFDNSTLFDDIIYMPSLGNRQYRLKLIGNKTSEWDGQLTSPGFVFNNDVIQDWQSGKDYKKGELVIYKSKIYTAIQFIVASDEFSFLKWHQVDKSSIKIGMLPNFAYNAKKFENMYDVDNQMLDESVNSYSNGLIGYRERAYLSDMSVNLTSQTKFYQGYIRDKGTKNAITSLANATFNNIAGSLEFNEEWAFRVGEYGAVESNQFVEVQLADSTFVYNPIAISFLQPGQTADDEVISIYKNTLYKKPLSYTTDIFAVRNDDSIYENDIKRAGYVNLNDIDATVFDIDALLASDLISTARSGFKIAIANDVNNDWDVYRVDETGVIVNSVSYALDSLAYFSTSTPHCLNVGDVFAVKNFSDAVDGFYIVNSVTDINTVLVSITSALEATLVDTPVLTSTGTIFKLQSVRFSSLSELAAYSPNFGWKLTDNAWIDSETAWTVWSRKEPWQYNSVLPGASNISNTFYGRQVSLSYDGRIVFATAPGEDENVIKIVVQLASGEFERSSGISLPKVANTTVGNVLAISPYTLAVSSEDTTNSLNNKLYLFQLDGPNPVRTIVNTYNSLGEIVTSESVVIPYEILPATGDTSFGTAIAISQDDKWLFVGSASSGIVYCYTKDADSKFTILTDKITSSRLTGDFAGFGNAIATNADGSVLVVGASRATTSLLGDGAAYVFVRKEVPIDASKPFELLQRIDAPVQSIGGKFGYTVATRNSGSEIIVGAPNISIIGYKHGMVFRFVKSSSGQYVNTQTIKKPYAKFNERFGTNIATDDNTNSILVSSLGAYSINDTVIDSGELLLDGGSTIIVDRVRDAGAVYVYDLVTHEDETVYCFAQSLNLAGTNSGDNFGESISIRNGIALVGAPTNSLLDTDSDSANDVSKTGAILWFENATKSQNWVVTRKQQDTVDLANVVRLFLYNRKNQAIVSTLDYIDPAKGKILGIAEQDISFKTTHDPAIYNIGTDSDVNVNSGFYWATEHVGKVWWNLSTMCYIDYEQDSVIYRNKHWGMLFPGSTVEVLEWVESDVLPSLYASTTNDGEAKYSDDSAYVVHNVVDPFTGIIQTKYYFWVKNKSLVPNIASRRTSIKSIASIIEHPEDQDIPYAAILKSNSISLFNAESLISADDTILHIDYALIVNSNLIHNEYELVQENLTNATLPTKIVNKLIDSLSGSDKFGLTVPDYKLGAAERYGITIRPRQSMIVNRITAVKNMCQYVNAIFATTPMIEEFDISGLYVQDPMPTTGWDISVKTLEERAYYDPELLHTGDLVLVESDSSFNNQWTIYEVQTDKSYRLVKSQGYYTPDYWEKIDWYVADYDYTVKPTYTVATYKDISKLTLKKGNSVKVTNNGDGRFAVFLVNSELTLTLVGVEEGTIKLKDSLWAHDTNSIGFGNDNFDTVKFDMCPDIELRAILETIRDTLFKGTLEGKFNELFFNMLNYILSEQTTVDWAFKTSFVSVLHKLRKLSQFPNYIKDNQTYYEDYINEVKPYRTKIREYILDYEGTDSANIYSTDFDLPSYYDTDLAVWRSPNGEHARDDTLLSTTAAYSDWNNNHGYYIDSIQVTSPGKNYTPSPKVTVWIDGVNDTTADLEAVVDFYTGEVLKVIVNNPGKIHYKTPIIKIEGDGLTETGEQSCVCYPILVNSLVRSFNTKVKFDRITYNSTVKQWAAYTSYSANDIVSYNNTAYKVIANIVTSATFEPDQYELVNAATFNNAADRTMAYYSPTVTMPAKELARLFYGTEYPGNLVDGSNFVEEYDADTNIQSFYKDTALGTRPEDINVDGGKYVDMFSSHAPEELLPGYVYDTLDIKVFTVDPNNPSVNPIGYRVTKTMAKEAVTTFDITYTDIGRAYPSVVDTTRFDSVTDVEEWKANTSYYKYTLVRHPDSGKIYSVMPVNPINEDTAPALAPAATFDYADFVEKTNEASTKFDQREEAWEFSRISKENTTTLRLPLLLSDTSIFVEDASVLQVPNPTVNQPGVIFVNGEKITYYTLDLATNELGQLRRGVWGTGAPDVHLAGMLVVDASTQQKIPGNAMYSSWLRPGFTTPVFGDGLMMSETEQAMFLKDKVSYLPWLPGDNAGWTDPDLSVSSFDQSGALIVDSNGQPILDSSGNLQFAEPVKKFDQYPFDSKVIE